MPSKQLKEAATYLRRAAWHLRQGGRSQLTAFRTRQNITPGADARPKIHTISPLKKLFSRTSPSLQLDFPELDAVPRPPRYGNLRTAVILDDFSLAAWGHEFNTVPITPTTWQETFATETIDLLFVESAWAGNSGAWRYQLTGTKAPSTALQELVNHCKHNKIPTVFWNKEDPPHFADFLETARLFDHVFTSDSNKIPDYTKALGHNRVQALAFAAQDAIHNPIRPAHGFHERDIAFAGMYFAHKYPERRQQMDLLLGAAYRVSNRMETGLEIFSRFLGDNKNYQFPSPLDQRVVGSLPYSKMLTAYKAYKVFLNVNSVTDSPSMCARRVFEITASGTPVVTTRSAAIPHFFSLEQVPVVDTPADAEHTLRALVQSPEYNSRTAHLAQRTIWENHTYTHRAEQVLKATGLAPQELQTTLPGVSAIVCTNRPAQLNHILKTVAGFEGMEIQLNLLTHGHQISESETRALARDLGITELNLLSAPATLSLGQCLNELVGVADGQIITKIDDDDRYGANYLRDLLYAQRFSNADIVGKQAHYMHLSASGATILRNPEREHRWTTFVMGPTITGRRQAFIENPFGALSRGEDTDFLTRLAQSGGTIYSADRYNFMQMRVAGAPGESTDHAHSADHAHAWDVSERELLASGRVVFYGQGTEHVMI